MFAIEVELIRNRISLCSKKKEKSQIKTNKILLRVGYFLLSMFSNNDILIFVMLYFEVLFDKRCLNSNFNQVDLKGQKAQWTKILLEFNCKLCIYLKDQYNTVSCPFSRITTLHATIFCMCYASFVSMIRYIRDSKPNVPKFHSSFMMDKQLNGRI